MERYVYVGCRTTEERNARGKGISVFKVDAEGKWKLLQLVEGLVNPSFLCLDRTGHFLYTVHGDQSEISSFSIGHAGKLSYMNTVSTEGINPVHLSVDKTNRWIFVANLQTGTVAIIPRESGGKLLPVKELYMIPGDGSGTVSHPHQVQQDNTGNYLIVSCQGRTQGIGQVDTFRIHSDSGELEQTCSVRSAETAEPRHVVFHPNNIWCYGVNEKDYSATVYDFDEARGILTPKQNLTTLPPGCTAQGWASGILVTPDGKYVVVSNRKYDSVTSFHVHEKTGMLEYCDCVRTGGKQPRYITWDHRKKCIIAANELSDTIVEIALDYETGKMRQMGQQVASGSPVCVIFK